MSNFSLHLSVSFLALRHLHFFCLFFFFNDTATTEIYTLSLHDALPISPLHFGLRRRAQAGAHRHDHGDGRSEEHTSELQSPDHLVCRLLLEKKKQYAGKSLPAL